MRNTGRLFSVALAFMLWTLQAGAATEAAGRNFNHATTGFTLSGGHAVAACETCHVGGVFKGTPRACDGCHAVGKRVVATPKNDRHIVTDAPCESCHFNTATWLGARYNHGAAVPGQCQNCHNGRQAAGRPGSHNTGGVKQTATCDNCHRSSAWVVLGMWNHKAQVTAGKTCNDAACHSATGDAKLKAVTSNPKHLPWPSVAGAPATFTSCENCHLSMFTFTSVRYNHPAGMACDACHNGTYNLGAVRGKPANHIPDGGAACASCHTSNYSWKGMNHNLVTAQPCKTCHLSPKQYLGNMTTKSYGHEGFKTSQDCISCHATRYTSWNHP